MTGEQLSAELAARALAAACTAVYVGTPGRCVYANPALLELVGPEAAAGLLASGLGAFFEVEEWERLAAEMGRRPTRPATKALELRLARRGREARWVRLAYRLLEGSELFVVTLEDVSELCSVQTRLLASESRQRALMDSLPFMAWLKDEDGRFLAANQPFVEAAGVKSVEEIVGLTDADLWPSELAAKYRSDDLSVMRGRKRLRTEEVVHHPEGDVWHETWKTPIYDPEGSVVGTAGVAEDITERKAAEFERLHILGQMQRLERLESLGFLAGGIAHDFNNLLAGLFGSVERAHQLSEPGEIREQLEHALAAFERARRLTGQLLTFSTGGEPVKQTTDVGLLLRETVEFALRGSAVRATFELDEALWPAECDHGQIGQVIHNIALNAVQAMPEGGRLFVIGRNVAREELSHRGLPPASYVEFSFRDEGAGIPPDVLEHVFDPFFTTKPGGTGLGLATSHSILRRHNGRLWAESRVGFGATFRMLLPAIDEKKPSQRPEPKNSSTHRGRGRALLLDDEPMLRELLATLLEELGYEVTAVESGAEALRAHAEAMERGEPFRVALLDLTIPGGLGGREVMAEVRMRDTNIAGIASSGYAGDPVLADPTSYGFDSCLTKPYRFAELSRQLDFAVARRSGPG